MPWQFAPRLHRLPSLLTWYTLQSFIAPANPLDSDRSKVVPSCTALPLSGAPDDQHVQPPRCKEGDTIAVITCIEQQVSFNYNILQSHRQSFQHLNDAVGQLQTDMGGVVAFMKRMCDDLRLGQFLHRAM